MLLSIGIVGLPNVGKSTLFQAITKKQVNIANYPFCTIDPNVGVVIVPDERVNKLAELTKSAKKIYTTIEFYDIAGLVKGANKGEGLGNKFLANIRETNAIVYVLRAFINKDIANVQSEINPIIDKDILDTELLLKDLKTVDKRLSGLEKASKTKNKEDLKELSILKKIKDFLEEGKILNEQNFTKEERKNIYQYQLLTMKQRLYLLNGKDNEISQEIIKEFKKDNKQFLIMDLVTEFETAGFSKEERTELGLPEKTKLDVLIKKMYEILGLITFFTTGSDETRAWTIKSGAKAPEAGGVIHSDLESHFIKADVINWKDLVNAGGISQAREKGLIRTEGKEYIIMDGDVIEIKHNA